jgi:hypothetical protein
MRVAPNAFNTLNTTLQYKSNGLADFRKKAEDRLSEKEDKVIRFDEV